MTPDPKREPGVPTLPVADWLGWTTRFILFTGKGGVGKTTVAAATAVALADAGRSVLLVSTDPASNLSDVFQMPAGHDPDAVADVPGLDLMDLDPHAAADRYRTRVTDPYRGVLPATEFAALQEKLAGACTVEVAAFDTFARLLADPTSIRAYDHVVFDTAPTGHTLRLLSLPAAWADYLGANPDATSCLGPLAGLQDDRPIYAAAVATLKDRAATTVVLVTRPDRGALTVAATAADELRQLGIDRQALIINGLLVRPHIDDAVAAAFSYQQVRALDDISPDLATLPTQVVPLVATDLVGIAALRHLTGGAASPPDPSPARPAPATDDQRTSMTDLIDELEPAGHGVILVTGKGGAGKTTVAGLIAAHLARRGHRVHLATTDPAGHAAAVTADLPALTSSAIDPGAATRSYVEGRLSAARRSGMDGAHLELLAEDLRSPCSQEVAVFQAFHRLLGRARDEFVVIDTAPTGHTLLLLDRTGAFHRQAMETMVQQPGHVITPLTRLRDREYSKVLIVALAETTPVSEAGDLQADLRRAEIEPYGWVINATMSGSGTTDPVLGCRAASERTQIERVRSQTSRMWIVPWSAAVASGTGDQ